MAKTKSLLKSVSWWMLDDITNHDLSDVFEVTFILVVVEKKKEAPCEIDRPGKDYHCGYFSRQSVI